MKRRKRPTRRRHFATARRTNVDFTKTNERFGRARWVDRHAAANHGPRRDAEQPSRDAASRRAPPPWRTPTRTTLLAVLRPTASQRDLGDLLNAVGALLRTADASHRVALDLVALYKAVGGGWGTVCVPSGVGSADPPVTNSEIPRPTGAPSSDPRG
jgi:hypothetical protein